MTNVSICAGALDLSRNVNDELGAYARRLPICYPSDFFQPLPRETSGSDQFTADSNPGMQRRSNNCISLGNCTLCMHLRRTSACRFPQTSTSAFTPQLAQLRSGAHLLLENKPRSDGLGGVKLVFFANSRCCSFSSSSRPSTSRTKTMRRMPSSSGSSSACRDAECEKFLASGCSF
jgi:hypothetical protein